jgi:hypothetical protein
MITQKQHLEICKKIDDLQALGVPVYTYNDLKVTGVDIKLGEIFLKNKDTITHRSYEPWTKLNDAWKKFIIKDVNLYQVKRCRLLHS